MNRIFLSTSLSPNFIFLKLMFVLYTDKSYFIFDLECNSYCVYDNYNVPFLSIIVAFLIKLYASFLLINAKLTR